MREILQALARGLWALKQLVDVAGIVAIAGLFVVFGLQFRHPPSWDNFGVVMQIRKLADPVLSGIASSLDLAWPAEKPSFLPIALTIVVFFVRSLVSVAIDRAAGRLRGLAAKQARPKRRRAGAPAEASVAPRSTPVTTPASPPERAEPARALSPAAAAPSDTPLPQTAPALPVQAPKPAAVPAAAPATPLTPTPLPSEGTLLSDFLHFDPSAAKTPGPSGHAAKPGTGRVKLGRTPTPIRGRRPAAAGEGPLDQEGETLSGQELVPVYGRYEVIEELGRGGMGVVYKARDPKIDRVVAIKSILTSHGDDETLDEYEKRFRREVLAVGKLAHPSIVTVYDFIEDHMGRPAMVMEFVDGETLQQLATHQRPALLRTIDIMIQTAEALDHAHAQGIVHRDMKPANIMLARDGRAKVSDFGIAKVGGMTMTNTQGKLMGTPAFMSPEQFTGRKVDGRSDLFSLGAILYWLVTGERPFSGETLANLAYQVVHVTLPSVREKAPGLPPQLDTILSRCMAKSPDDRYPRALDLAEDLKALRDDRPLPSLGHAADGEHQTMLVDNVAVVDVIDEPEPGNTL